MKKKLLIVFGVLFLFCLLLVGGGIFYASTKITPAVVRDFSIKQLEQIFPNAQVKLGKLDISFGFYAKIELEDLDMDIDKTPKQAKLVSVKKLYAKIPLWAIILGSGKVEVVLDSPQIYFYQYSKEEHNWAYAMGTKPGKVSDSVKPEEVKPKQDQNQAASVGIPGFLSVMKLNFELKNLGVHYSLFDSQKRNGGDIVVSSFKIKDLNFEKETVVQMYSNIQIKDTGSLDISVIAELYLNKLVQESKLPVKTEIIVSNLKLAQLKNTPPEIKTNINLEVLKDGGVNGSIKTKFGESDLLDAKYSMDKSSINIDDIVVKLKLAEILKLVEFDNKMVDMGQSVFTLSGNTKILTAENNIDSNFKFDLNPGINFKYEGINGGTTISGTFKKTDLLVNVITKVLDGTANFSLKGFIDPNNKKFDLAKLTPFNMKLDINNMKLTRDLISGILYKKDANKNEVAEKMSQDTTTKVAAGEEKKSPMVLPPGDIYIGINQVFIGEDSFQGKGYIKIRDGKIETKDMNFKLGEGNIALTHSTAVNKNNTLDNKFNLTTKNINFTSFTVFLPPSIDKIKGNVNITTSGDVVLVQGKEPAYNVKLDMSATKGEVKGLNLKNYVEDVIKNVAVLKNYANKAVDVDDSFDLFSLNGIFTDSKYQIDKFLFDGAKQKIKMTGSGEVFPPKFQKESFLELTSEDALGISSFLEKEAGTRILPLRLKGIGFSLKPDAGYTLKKLADGAIKQQGKKAAKKLIEEKSDKLLKGILKDGKNPLKGLFGN